MSAFRDRRPFRAVLGGVAALAFGLSLSACGGSDEGAGAEEGAVRMALSNGYGPSGPVDDFIAGLSCYAERNGLGKPLVTHADGDVNTQLNDMDSMIARANQVDGVFVIPVDPGALKPAYDRADKAGISVVDPLSPDNSGKFLTDASAHVAPDDLGVPQMIVDHLTGEHADAKNIVVLGPQPGQAMSDTRSANFKKAAEQAGLKVVGEIHLENITTEEAQQKMEDFLTQHPETQAVFSQNGAMARGAALAGKSQGRDLVITSLDNDEATLNAVKGGDIAAAFGADLFSVAFKASRQVEAIQRGEKAEYLTVPYQKYTKDDAGMTASDARCGEYQE